MPAKLSGHILLAVFAWGFNFVAVKLLYDVMSPAALSLARFLLMWAAMIPICLLAKESLRYPDRRQAVSILGVGALSMGVYMVLFLEGIKYTNPSEASILMATSPLWTMILEVLFRQDRFRVGVVIGALVSLVGVWIVVGNTVGTIGTTPLGVGLMLVSAACWALSVVLSRPLLHDMSALRLVTLSMPGALLVLLPYGLLPMTSVAWTQFGAVNWLLLLHVGLLSGAVGFYGFFTGVRKIGASGAMLYQFLVPVIATGFSIWILGVPLTVQKVLGGLVVISGVWLAMRSKEDPQRERLISE